MLAGVLWTLLELPEGQDFVTIGVVSGELVVSGVVPLVSGVADEPGLPLE